MSKLFTLVGWSTLLLAYGVSLLITASGYVQHVIAWSSGYWQPLRREDNLETVLTRYEIEREVNLEGDIAGVTKVLVIASEPEISVYLDSEGKIVAARLGIASPLWRLNPLEVTNLLVLLGIGFIFWGKREQVPSASLRSLSFLMMSLVLCYISASLLVYYPLHLWAVVIGPCLLVVAFVLGCVALISLYSRPNMYSFKQKAGTP